VFALYGILVYLEVEVVEAGAMEEVAFQVSKSAEWLLRKSHRIESVVPGKPWIQCLDVEGGCIANIGTIDEAEFVAIKRIIDSGVLNRDGESALQRGNSGEVQAFQCGARACLAGEAVRERNSIDISRCKALACAVPLGVSPLPDSSALLWY
jgi:hypothetical protein